MSKSHARCAPAIAALAIAFGASLVFASGASAVISPGDGGGSVVCWKDSGWTHYDFSYVPEYHYQLYGPVFRLDQAAFRLRDPDPNGPRDNPYAHWHLERHNMDDSVAWKGPNVYLYSQWYTYPYVNDWYYSAATAQNVRGYYWFVVDDIRVFDVQRMELAAPTSDACARS